MRIRSCALLMRINFLANIECASARASFGCLTVGNLRLAFLYLFDRASTAELENTVSL
jgi:hypothetical protein